MNCRRLVLSLSLVFVSTVLATSIPQSATPQKSDAQKSFELLKSLAGSWKGQGPEGPVRVSLRVTSGGSALLQEMVPAGRADDPTNGDDDPITMIYLDGDRLTLTMYCDSFKNRPRMSGLVAVSTDMTTSGWSDMLGGPEAAVDSVVVRDLGLLTSPFRTTSIGVRHPNRSRAPPT